MMVFGDIALINQNQYMPPTNSSSKTAPNITRMANASNSGSSGSVSGSFGKLVRVLRIEKGRALERRCGPTFKGSSPD
jgi:hypothetical protein